METLTKGQKRCMLSQLLRRSSSSLTRKSSIYGGGSGGSKTGGDWLWWRVNEISSKDYSLSLSLAEKHKLRPSCSSFIPSSIE
ncbi:hypothetical protein HanIR_Chr11g0507551 [Helianthus annuus]|nr:hypothetical protein HanIR_Chr11g0507551 [Helianthus annuus]